MTRSISICLLTALTMATAGAQTPQPAAAAAKLREFDATYQAGLQKIQTPLLNDYARKLQQLITTAPVTDQPAIRAELGRVQKLIATGGIVDLRSAGATQVQGAAPGPLAGSTRTPPGAVLALITPAPWPARSG